MFQHYQANCFSLLVLVASVSACAQSSQIVTPTTPSSSASTTTTEKAASVSVPAPQVAAAPASPVIIANAPATNPEYEAFFDDAVRLINEYRATKRLPALRRDARLDAIAANHSSYMAAKDDLSHEGFNDRFNRADMQSCAENVAWNQITAAELVNDWIASAVHDKNLLKAAATKVGMGRAKGYTTYFVCQP